MRWVVVAVVAALATPALAQVSNLKVRISENWALHPAFAGNTLVGYLAQQVAGTPAPNGFTLVWFARQPGDTFTMEGYTGTLVAEAAHKVTMILANPSAFEFSELAALAATGAEPEAGFVPMVDGLAITDPLQPYAGSMPAELLEWFVGLGAEGATEMSGLCTEDPAGVEGSWLEVMLRVHVSQLETLVLTGGAEFPPPGSGDLYWWACEYTAVVPPNPWTLDLPREAGEDGRCGYSRPLDYLKVCCTVRGPWWWFSPPACAMTTLRWRNPQRGYCGGYPPGANCHSDPQCNLPPPPPWENRPR